ncbi:MAG: TrmB family transcriptional regulator [Candidatus Hodarchaeales archaeon]|jgi:sugar-specific transcriptional regulator TrmB
MTLAQEKPISSTELENFGLSNYEAKTYLNMLSMGLSTAKEISDESEVPFGRIYDVLGSLEDKGLIERQDSRPKKYLANEPKIIMKNLLAIKNQELDQLTKNASVIEEKLTSLYTSQPSESAFWSVALEDESIQRHNQKILEAESEILIYLNMVYSIHILSPEEIKEFLHSIEEVSKRGVSIKLLIGGIDEQDFLKNNKDLVYEFVPLLKHIEIRFTSNVTNTFDIIDKEKVILKISNPINSNEYFALIYLWQKTFAEKMRQKYFDLWERGEKLEFDFSFNSD